MTVDIVSAACDPELGSITLKQLAILSVVSAEPMPAIDVIKKLKGAHKASVSRFVNKLVELEMLEVALQHGDRRKKVLTATAKGKNLLDLFVNRIVPDEVVG